MSSRYYPKRDAGLKSHDYAKSLEEVSQELGISREMAKPLRAAEPTSPYRGPAFIASRSAVKVVRHQKIRPTEVGSPEE